MDGRRRSISMKLLNLATLLLNRRSGTIVLAIFFLFALRQLINSQMELDEVKDHLSKNSDEYLARNGAMKKDSGDYVYNIDKRIQNRTGLTTEALDFLLNGKPLRILSGSIHYFRFPPEYWRARLLALKASGLNTVTTYVAWNAHEPTEGTFDFSGMLNLANFIQTAHDLEIYVILRVGPYICAEWEWGGLPSWLLRQDDMKVRTSDPAFMNPVQKWFDKLLPIIKPYQFTHGGPVIAVQVENEYASFPNYDAQYVVKLAEMVVKGGIKEFLFVCDDKNGVLGRTEMNYGGMMRTINFQHNPATIFKRLQRAQPNRPLFVTEYWTGWFNWWGGPDNNLGVPWLNTLDIATFESNTKELLDTGGHLNMYMFAGGTNFKLMNGGMIQTSDRQNGDETSPDTTSYDYSALVSEEGLLTPKFHVTRKLLQALDPDKKLSDPPPEPELMSYGSAAISSYVNLSDLMMALKSWMIKSKNPLPMEKFPANGGRKLGQAYGYALYETKVDGNSMLKIKANGSIRDRAVVYFDTVYRETVHPRMSELSIEVSDTTTQHTISFLVENQGRVNWVSREQPGTFDNQRKGIIGDVTCNGKVLTDWRIWPLEFDAQFIAKLDDLTKDGSLVWHSKMPARLDATALLKAQLILGKSNLKDTFLELEGFEKGIVIVNGNNLGRYWNSAGPQKRLFLPGVWLRPGVNEILIFEESKVGSFVSFHNTNGMKKNNKN